MKKSLIALALCVYNIAFGENFKASGIGDTVEDSKQNAVLNAIRSSVGEFVFSKEEMNNEELSNKIVNYSNAYVKKIEILEQEKLSDNTYKTIVKVDIESQKLIEALKDQQSSVIENVIDDTLMKEAQNHFAKNEQNKETANNFEELVKTLLLDPIIEHKPILHITIIDKLQPVSSEEYNKLKKTPMDVSNDINRIEKYHENKDIMFFKIYFSLEIDQQYLSSIRRVLNESKSNGYVNAIEYKIEPGIKIRDNKVIREYTLDDNKLNVIKNIFTNAELNKISVYNYRPEIIFLDKEGQEMDVLMLGQENKFISNLFFVSAENHETPNVGGAMLDPWRCNLWRMLPDFRTSPIGFASGKTKAYAYIGLSKEQISQLKDIKVSFY